MLDIIKEAVCDYSAFIGEITENVKNKMGGDYSIQIYKVTKNNSLELDSLVILKKGKNFVPNIYLMPYYEAYLQGVGIQELAERLCDTYRSNKAPAMSKSFSYTYEDVKSNIVYRLVNFEKNKGLLNKIPYIKYMDLAITYHCLVGTDQDGIGSIRITNEHLGMWDTSLKEIHELAVKNTKGIFPPIIKSMDEVIYGICREEYNKGYGLSEPIHHEFSCYENIPKGKRMYILSNRKGINGAACLLYDSVLKKFSDQMQSDFYILPSSIHELILVPYDNTISKEAFVEIVRDINSTQVAREEVLSDRVYIYTRINNSISM